MIQFVCVLLTTSLATVPSPADVFQQWRLEASTAPSLGAQIAEAGLWLLDKPYVAHTLESPAGEQLVVRFDGFDCWTFMETAYALAYCQQTDGSFDDYKHILQAVRYRDGVVDDYASRLHYTVDWAYAGMRAGRLQDMTAALGGQLRHKTIAFMSEHANRYPALSDPKQKQRIQVIEMNINKRDHYLLSTKRLRQAEGRIQSGDLVAIATDIPLLDVQHVGIALRRDDRIYLLHASSKGNRVMVSEKPLVDWLAQAKRAEGVMIYRPLPVSSQ